MTRKTNPPPIRIPQSLMKDRESGEFFSRLSRDIYLIWQKTGGGNVMTIGEGGIGADTAEGARANLAVYSASEVDALIENSRRYALLVS